MKEPGQKIDTDFTITAVEKGEKKEVEFRELLDRPSVVSVYMKNNTSSCDRQNESLAEHSEWFEKNGYNLIAISKDTAGSHKKYANKKGINYTLVSDPETRFASATNSIVEKSMYGKKFEGPSRSAFVIDTDGTILAAIEKIDTKNHASELKELVESLKN
ncbi:MAG: redoxin domain-containing protein [Balneolaceae bacterium]